MKLRRIFFTGLIITISSAFFSFTEESGEETTIQWLSIDEALEKSKTEPRLVFVDVYADYCGWCKKMDRITFSDPVVVEYVNEHYYAVKLDAQDYKRFYFKGQKTSNAEIARAFRVTGLPTIVLINEEFSQFTPNPGFKGPEDFLKMLTAFKQNTLASK